MSDANAEDVISHFDDHPSGLSFGWKDRFNVFVYKRKRKKTKTNESIVKDQFLAFVGIGEQEKGEELQQVLIPSLPDLLSFLNQVLPLCVEARTIGEADEKLHDEVNQVSKAR